MAKTGKQADNLGEEIENKRSQHSITLTMTNWRERFTPEQRKIIIADALNDCTYNHGLNITGYLISNTRLHLVLKLSLADIPKMLSLFHESVKRELSKHPIKANEDDNEFTRTDKHLFIIHDTVNDYLIRLITGKKIELGYYDPQLARLKDNINSSAFCSAIDYSGAMGPVIVKMFKTQ
jgi:hypothetical protein